MTGKYNIINIQRFKKLISVLPKDFDVYGFEFNREKAILRTLNRSHTVYLEIEIEPRFFGQYEIAYPNKVILHGIEIKQNNINFNEKLTEYGEDIFKDYYSLENNFNGRRTCLIRMDDLLKPIKAYKGTFVNIRIDNNGFTSIFDGDVLGKALITYFHPTHALIGLEHEDSNLYIHYTADFIKVRSLVAPRIVPHTNYDVRIKDCWKMIKND